jgi:hypothetical protein
MPNSHKCHYIILINSFCHFWSESLHTNNIVNYNSESFVTLASSTSTVVEYSPHHPKVKCLSPVTADTSQYKMHCMIVQ